MTTSGPTRIPRLLHHGYVAWAATPTAAGEVSLARAGLERALLTWFGTPQAE